MLSLGDDVPPRQRGRRRLSDTITSPFAILLNLHEITPYDGGLWNHAIDDDRLGGKTKGVSICEQFYDTGDLCIHPAEHDNPSERAHRENAIGWSRGSLVMAFERITSPTSSLTPLVGAVFEHGCC